MGIEPTSSAWKAEVLPLNYTRLKPLQNHDTLYSHDSQNFRLASEVHKKRPLFWRAKILTVLFGKPSGCLISCLCRRAAGI